MTREARSIRCPETVLGWIPWYGETDERGERLLDARQRGAVEAHASECAECRAELDMIAGAPYEIDVDLPDPDRVFHEITARIDAGEAEGMDTAPTPPSVPVAPRAATRPLSVDELARVADWVFDDRSELELVREERAAPPATGRVIAGPWSRPAAWVAAAAIFLLGLFGGRVLEESSLPFLQGEGTIYESAAAEAPGNDALIDVVFADHVTVAELANDLRALGVEIVSGPSGVGRYRLRVAGSADTADTAAIAARLSGGARPIALYAEPVLGESRTP